MPNGDNSTTRVPPPPNPADASTTVVEALTASFALQNVSAGLRQFDGTCMSLKDFIQDIKSGMVYIQDGYEGQYVRAILTLKLRGAARDCTFSKNINTINDLVKILKERFAPGKDFAYYSNQIHRIQMKKDEKIGSFYDRLNILIAGATNALEAETNLTGNTLKHAMKGTKIVALDRFIAKLPDIRMAIETQNPKNLEAAYKEAVRLECNRGRMQ